MSLVVNAKYLVKHVSVRRSSDHVHIAKVAL